MNILSSLFKKKDLPKPVTKPLEYKTTRASKLMLDIHSDDVSQYQDAYKQVDAVYSCVSYAADICSQIEIKAYKKENGKLVNYDNDLLLLWLEQPNPFTSMSETIKLYIQSYLLTGKAFLTFEKVGKKYEGWILDPAKVKIVPHEKKFIEGYIYADTISYKEQEILYFKNGIGSNLYEGISPLGALVDILELDSYAIQDLKDYYENSLIAQGIFTSEYPLTSEQIEGLREQFRKLHTLGKSGRHAHIIAPNNLKFTPMKISPKDGLLLDSLGISEDRIYKIYRLPKILIGGGDRASNGTEIGALKVNYINSFIRPMLYQLTKHWTTYFRRILKDNSLILLPDYTNIPEVNTALTEKIDSVKDAVSTGLISRTEGRVALGFDPIEGAKYMDSIFAPSYLIGTQNTDLITGDNLVFGETEQNK